MDRNLFIRGGGNWEISRRTLLSGATREETKVHTCSENKDVAGCWVRLNPQLIESGYHDDKDHDEDHETTIQTARETRRIIRKGHRWTINWGWKNKELELYRTEEVGTGSRTAAFWFIQKFWWFCSGCCLVVVLVLVGWLVGGRRGV